jgi:hypothetical protein
MGRPALIFGSRPPGRTGMRNGLLIVRINRILRPGDGAAAGEAGQPCLSATWRLTDGSQVRGIFAIARYRECRLALGHG